MVHQPVAIRGSGSKPGKYPRVVVAPRTIHRLACPPYDRAQPVQADHKQNRYRIVEISGKNCARNRRIPIDPTVQAAADVLGFDVLEIANEGKFIAVVAPDLAEKYLQACKSHPLGKDAAIIGQILDAEDHPLVQLKTKIGGKRIVQMPYGRQLPRIC